MNWNSYWPKYKKSLLLIMSLGSMLPNIFVTKFNLDFVTVEP